MVTSRKWEEMEIEFGGVVESGSSGSGRDVFERD